MHKKSSTTDCPSRAWGRLRTSTLGRSMNRLKLLLALFALASCAAMEPKAEGTILVTFDPEAPAIVRVVPYYPENAQTSRLSGQVEVTYAVSDRGLPEQVKVTRSTDVVFDDAAVHAIHKSRYFPNDGRTMFHATIKFSVP